MAQNIPSGDRFDGRGDIVREQWMTEENQIQIESAHARYGQPAELAARGGILAALEQEILLEAEEEGDHDRMRLLCGQLFSFGLPEDSLAVWRAKSCNFDTMCAIEVQLMCGAGLAATKEFLSVHGSADAAEALDLLLACEAAGDFEGFTIGV